MNGDFVDTVIRIFSFLGGYIGGTLFIRLYLRPVIGKKLTLLRYPDYDRKLSQNELTWLNDTSEATFKEVSKNKRANWFGILLYVIIFLASLIILPIMFLGTTEWLIDRFHQDVKPDAISWYRIDATGGLSIIAGMCIAGWLSLVLVLKLKSPIPHIKAFFGHNYKNTSSRWYSISVDIIRKRQITTHVAADISTIVSTIVMAPFRRIANVLGCGAILFIALIVIVLPFELKNNTTIYPDSIERSPYLSLSMRSYTFQDIAKVDRTCRIEVKAKNPALPKAELKYQLVMTDGKKVTLFGRNKSANLKNQIQAVKHWHNLMPKHQITPVNISSTHPKEISPTLAECKSATIRRCDWGCAHALLRVFDLPTKK